MEEISFSVRDLFFVAPIIALVLASFLPLLVKVVRGNREPDSFATLVYGMMGVVAAAGMSLAMVNKTGSAFAGALVMDGLSSTMSLVVLFLTAMALVYARENLATNNHQFSEFVFLLLNSAAGMLIVCWAADLMTLFIGIELMSLCLYVLIAMSSEERLSKEAAFKYFILGSFASAILLYGIALIFGTTGTPALQGIADQAPKLMEASRIFSMGLILLILGMAFKVSLVPLHAWAPDVYQGAPTPVTAFMATGVKAASFVAFLRLVKTDALAAEGADGVLMGLQWIAVLTMVVGNLAAVVQSDFKRMLAYSSVAHSGYVFLGLIVAGVSGENAFGSTAVIVYLISYAIMTGGALGIVSILERNENTRIQVEDLAGLGKTHPILAAFMALFLLSLAGIPPTVGFFAKLFIFGSAIEQGLYWMVIWAAISSMIGVYYYLRPLVVMYMREPIASSNVDASERPLSLGFVGLSALLVLVLGLLSQRLLEWVQVVFSAASVAGL